jgi:antitoxin component YwqK of YwqJK toxin-antitoxin module
MGIFNLFRSSNPENDPYWEFDKANHYRPSLNKDDFYKFTGFDFGSFIFDPLAEYIGEIKYEKERCKAFSYGQKAAFYWFLLDMQVTNGGFIQYYFNDYGKYTPTIIKSLKHIGDLTMAELVNRSYELYLRDTKKLKQARAAGLEGLSGLYDQLEGFEELDDEYYKLHEETMENLENYIRKHPAEFCVDEEGREFNIEKGIKSGPFKTFYENGNPKEVIYYLNGKQTGEREEYYENGHMKLSIQKEANPNGFRHSSYHDNGQLAETAVFISKIEREGWWLKYHRDGSKKFEAEFVNGDFLIHNCWDEQGVQTLKDGTGLYVFDYSGWPGHLTHYEQEYKDYKRHGKQLTYSNGVLTIYQEMENDKEHGVTRTYDDNGQLKSEILYAQGKEISRKDY